MTKLTKTFSRFDVVRVPFPFVDGPKAKKRPALVVSSTRFGNQADHSVLAMITTSHHMSWPLDIEISGLEAAGLNFPSVIRMKLFTLDHRIIEKCLGKLSRKDQAAATESLRKLFGFKMS